MMCMLMSLVLSPLAAGGQSEQKTTDTVIEMHVLAEQDVNAYMEKVIDEYERLNPGIQIKLVAKENDAYKTAIQVAVGSDDPPDIFFVWSGEYTGKFVRNNQLADLTPAYASPWGDTITEATKTPFTLGGKIWAVPYSLESKVFYYNKEIFAEAGVTIPQTWEELIAAGKKIAAKGYTPLVMGGLNSWQECHYISLLNQKVLGADEIDKDYNLQRDREDLFSDPGYVESLTYLKGLKDEGLFPQNIASIAYETAQALFFSSQAAMFYGGTWNMAVWDGTNGAAPPDFKDSYGMFSMPAIDSGRGDHGYILGAPIGLAVSARSKNYAEAVDFLQFYTSVENQKQLVAETKRLPSVIGAVTPENASENLQWVAGYVEDATGMVGWLDTVVEISISNVYLNGLVSLMNESKSAEQVMSAVKAQAQEIQDTIGPINY
jgi:raffinose/stachyose/melibiose transport system substrate-binding protein